MWIVLIVLAALAALVYLAMQKNPDIKSKVMAAIAAVVAAGAGLWEYVQGWFQ